MTSCGLCPNTARCSSSANRRQAQAATHQSAHPPHSHCHLPAYRMWGIIYVFCVFAFLHPKCRFRVSFHPFPAQNREIGFFRFDGIFTHKFACFGLQVRIFRILPLCSAASQMQKNTGAKRKNNVKIFTNHTSYTGAPACPKHGLAREKVLPREGKIPTT